MLKILLFMGGVALVLNLMVFFKRFPWKTFINMSIKFLECGIKFLFSALPRLSVYLLTLQIYLVATKIFRTKQHLLVQLSSACSSVHSSINIFDVSPHCQVMISSLISAQHFSQQRTLRTNKKQFFSIFGVEIIAGHCQAQFINFNHTSL